MTIDFAKNIFIVFLIAIVASCGLIYEYLISHYTGIVIGIIDKAIYGAIGVMLAAMGAGSAYAGKYIKDNYTAFVILESLISISGSLIVAFLGIIYALSYWIPNLMYQELGMSVNWFNGLSHYIKNISSYMPYVSAFFIAFLIGMEIPVLTQIRGNFIKDKDSNFAIMYGADYVGAGIGAAIWVFWLLSLDINTISVIISSVNAFAGILFLMVFWKSVQKKKLVIFLKTCAIASIFIISIFGKGFHKDFEDMMYLDKVVHKFDTNYQHITITKNKDSYSMFINNKLQFSSSDEFIYHELLVQPVMNMNIQHKKILLIGGGDGLALREIFKWDDVESVTMLDLDNELVKFFSEPVMIHGKQINSQFIELNNNSFSDKRLHLITGDAFNILDVIDNDYDITIIDLPDPGHPNLNKLYSTLFYKKINSKLNQNGIMVVQSTSPYHAINTFLSIKKTVEHSNFNFVTQYHHNVPSFGEWGWTIATKSGKLPEDLISNDFIHTDWLTKDIFKGCLEFGKGFYSRYNKIKVNNLTGYSIYNYYKEDYKQSNGILINFNN